MEYDREKDYLYIDNDLITSDTSFKKIKDTIKKDYDAPKKNVKGFLVKFNIKDSKKEYMSIIITQITITPKLFIGATDDDLFKVFTYSPEEYKKYGLTESIVKKCIKAVKDNLISFENNKDSITDLLKLFKKGGVVPKFKDIDIDDSEFIDLQKNTFDMKIYLLYLLKQYPNCTVIINPVSERIAEIIRGDDKLRSERDYNIAWFVNYKDYKTQILNNIQYDGKDKLQNNWFTQWKEKFLKIKKEKKYKYVLIPLELHGHQNMLIINLEENKMYRLEPQYDPNRVGYEEEENEKINEELDEYAGFLRLTYVSDENILKKKEGLQEIELKSTINKKLRDSNVERGYCVGWSVLWPEYIISKNVSPIKAYDDLSKELGNKPDNYLYLIREYTLKLNNFNIDEIYDSFAIMIKKNPEFKKFLKEYKISVILYSGHQKKESDERDKIFDEILKQYNNDDELNLNILNNIFYEYHKYIDDKIKEIR